MSWYSGAQLTVVSARVHPVASVSCLQLAARAACEIMTPLGLPVEPEVHWISAVSSRSGRRIGCEGASLAMARAYSAAPSSRVAPASSGRASMTASVVTTAAGRRYATSSFIWPANPAAPPNRIGTAIAVGTAPSSWVPKKAVRNSTPVGRQSSTRSPCPTPRSARAAAHRAALPTRAS
nr:hypothetical protein [Streptomyces sp. LBUM 1477]